MNLIPGKLYFLLNERLGFWTVGQKVHGPSGIKHFDFNACLMYIGESNRHSETFLGPDGIIYNAWPQHDSTFEEVLLTGEKLP